MTTADISEIRSTKSEILNKFKIECQNFLNIEKDYCIFIKILHRFEFLSFDIRICLEFRDSNFEFFSCNKKMK